MANLQKLQRLDLGGCPIDDGAVEHLIGLKKLRRMHLGYVEMTYSSLKRWLNTRYMSSVYIDGESFAALREHPDHEFIQRRQGLRGMGSGLTIGPALERELDLSGLRERPHGSVPY